MDLFKDYMNSFLGAFFILVSILAIPEIRSRKKYWIPMLIPVIILCLLGFDKVRRDNLKEIENNRKSEELSNKVNRLNSMLVQDSVNNAEFKKNLEKQFHIIDSSNHPVSINKTYHTTIKKADNVTFNQ